MELGDSSSCKTTVYSSRLTSIPDNRYNNETYMSNLGPGNLVIDTIFQIVMFSTRVKFYIFWMTICYLVDILWKPRVIDCLRVSECSTLMLCKAVVVIFTLPLYHIAYLMLNADALSGVIKRCVSFMYTLVLISVTKV